MSDLETRLDRSALVVAHPDDEILWFSSVLERIGKVLICYLDVPEHPEWTAGRRAVAESYPLERVEFLGITEAVPFRGADWQDPVEVAEGLDLQRRPGTLPGFDPDRYRANYSILVRMLEQRLQNVAAVITHNPWGEYGNEEHVQVYRAVAALQPSLGYDIWYTNYCSDRAHALMLKHIDGRRSEYVALPTRPELAAPIETLYRQHDCWTWPFDDFQYFAQECFLRDPAPGGPDRARGSTVPLNFIKVADRAPPQTESGRLTPRRVAGALRRRARRLLGRGA